MHSARNANRADRPDRGQRSNRGSGRPRDGIHDRNTSNRTVHHQLPTVLTVVPGASVSIVMKIDQSTGHQVTGIVTELLTKGNHPRGIKVRLQDGRVGRVQKMAGENMSLAHCGNEGDSSLRHEQQILNGLEPGRRLGEQREAPSAALGLSEYIVTKRQGNKSGHSVAETGAAMENYEVVTCPVCTEFKGDEVAVAHHVNSHFE